MSGRRMHLDGLLEQLGYAGSPAFLRDETLAHAGVLGHLFRQARDKCRLRGAYVLRDRDDAPLDGAIVPLVYVCEASSDDEARRIHRLVWNQNVVPFVVVLTPRHVRLYSGFRYRANGEDRASGTLRAAIQFNHVMDELGTLSAEAIDTGRMFDDWRGEITVETRLDATLLAHLEALGARLRDGGMSKRDSNALIGKYVYLRYLRDREILSDRKLDSWGIDPARVFGRRATLTQFHALADRLHDWLNGSVFPLPTTLRRSLTRDQLRLVAGVFSGDDPGGQLHLDFRAYDFSFIPIETLSVIYEQFLHALDRTAIGASARDQGAYYTPIPVVDFMLDQLEARAPLRPGMRVLDPACGSGAFLVQCYRRLVERSIRDARGTRPRPSQLRELLTTSIFGVDSDPDACQVAELSLILTLLDYVDPPDLHTTRFKLPALRDRNLFCCDAFDAASTWVTSGAARDYDWIIGNPPWKEFKTAELANTHPHLAAWLDEHGGEVPIGDNQIAEAFTWRAVQLAADGGAVALLLPAMTLFKHASRSFREQLFRRVRPLFVANFANLAEVLFRRQSSKAAGRRKPPRVPAAALLFTVPGQPDQPEQRIRPDRATILVYSPFVANQVANQPMRANRRQPVWSLVINACELREVPYGDIARGDSLPWKLAMWGSPLDQRLLRVVERQWPSLGTLEDEGRIVVSEGLQLRHAASTKEKLEHHPELADEKRLVMKSVERLRNFFDFPEYAIDRVPEDETWVRKGRYELPAKVCAPPHIIVNAARTFAVFSDEFLVVPPRQVGIAAGAGEAAFLKALSLYLSSDFTRYHQLMRSTMLGIKRPRATLRSLRALPVPLADAGERELKPWVDLHAQLVDETRARFADSGDRPPTDRSLRLVALLRELNELVSDALKLDRRARALVHDLVHVKMALDDGKLGRDAMRPPTDVEIGDYAGTLQAELDAFVSDDDVRHDVVIVMDARSAMIAVELVWAAQRRPIEIVQANAASARAFADVRARLLQRRSQWVYFHRDLRIYEGEKVYLFKPLQRIHWTESQAYIDAGEIIADTLVGAEQ